jgi:hypothetical protein
MPRVALATALFLALALPGCTPPRPPPPLPEKPGEKSSVDVLLRHRGELALTDDQVARLEALEERRAAEVATLRDQLAELGKQLENKGGDRPADIGTGSGRTPGTGGRGMGGMGSSAGSGRSGRPPPGTTHRQNELLRLTQKVDDADTRAFVDAVSEVLTAAQRPRAENLATVYREALFDYQEAVRRRGGLPPGE